MRGTFVVQLRNVSQREADRMEGLVEEVDTGKQKQFKSENELIRFMRERVADIQDSPKERRIDEPGDHRS
ncbi:MAG: hypothetical protein LAP61_03795 [Acidobacteriia bacterium]|nr:hypothetical protein [Terriglobia bacterium]